MGSRDVAIVRTLASHQCGPFSSPGFCVICGLSLLLVLVLAPRGFSPGSPVFPSPQKATFPNSISIRIASPDHGIMRYTNLQIYLFIIMNLENVCI